MIQKIMEIIESIKAKEGTAAERIIVAPEIILHLVIYLLHAALGKDNCQILSFKKKNFYIINTKTQKLLLLHVASTDFGDELSKMNNVGKITYLLCQYGPFGHIRDSLSFFNVFYEPEIEEIVEDASN